MKTLIVSDSKCDFVDVLESCGAETECIEFQKVLTVNLEDYDSFCILPEESGAYLEARFREKLEKEAGKGKKIFLQFGDFRIFYVENQQTVLKAG